MDRLPLIAIVEDDDAVRQALASLMRSLGYNVAGYASAESFLDATEMRMPYALITDLQLPGMSGTDLQREIAARGCCVPTIVMTAFPSEQTQNLALRQGALAYITKPTDGDTIAGHLGAIFGSSA
jgi:FixJ family two-component response regulator